jgi:GNAT superfamily N-acetyltransferase
MQVDIVLTEEASVADRDAIQRTLHDFNSSEGWQARAKPLGLLLRDPATGETIGGLWGVTSYDWLRIEFLVIPEKLRGQDLGTRLITQAEAIAKERGCLGMWLTTLMFQARGFYEKVGFEVFGVMPDSPKGGTRYFMRKTFAPAPTP